MYIVFLNPQGNFDKNDSFWTEHPDFGGQLVYVKELALAMGELGHKVDMCLYHGNKQKPKRYLLSLYSPTKDLGCLL